MKNAFSANSSSSGLHPGASARQHGPGALHPTGGAVPPAAPIGVRPGANAPRSLSDELAGEDDDEEGEEEEEEEVSEDAL